MSRTSVAVGIVATLLFTTACCAMHLFVGGEEDWNLGIALVLCILTTIGIGVIGIVLSMVSFYRYPAERSVAALGLVLNLIPGFVWFALWVQGNWG